MVAAADEGSGFDVGKAHGESGFFIGGELGGRGVAKDGEVFGGGAEILSDGGDGDVVVAEVGEDVDDLLVGFAESDHETGLGGDIGAEGMGAGEHFEGAFVAGADADLFIEAGNGFDVVVEDVGGGVEDDGHGFTGALEVGDEDFDLAAGDAFADGADGGGEDGGAAVLLVVAVDAGDDGVFEAEGGAGFGDAAGFVEVHFEGGALLDGAKAAAPGAEVAQNHEGGGALVPAFAEVGAGCAFTDGVKAEVLDEALEFAVVVADGGGRLEPIWTAGLGLNIDQHSYSDDSAARRASTV